MGLTKPKSYSPVYPVLASPALASEIKKGKQALDGSGNVLTGTLEANYRKVGELTCTVSEPIYLAAGDTMLMSRAVFTGVAGFSPRVGDMIYHDSYIVDVTKCGMIMGDLTNIRIINYSNQIWNVSNMLNSKWNVYRLFPW